MTRHHGWFYNVDNNRDPEMVRRELDAMLEGDPFILGMCETTDLRLGKVDGYKLYRDTSTPGRDNLAAYVSDRHRLGPARWVDQQETWSRTKGPGKHPSRSILWLMAGRTQQVIGHAPPQFTDNTLPAQREYQRDLADLMNPALNREAWARRTAKSRHVGLGRPRMLWWDANRRPNQKGPGPTQLARLVGGEVVGARIDGVVAVNVPEARATYHAAVRGVPLRSDHGEALRVDFDIPERWLP